MDLDTVLAVDPFAFKPYLILWMYTLHVYFFLIWFRVRTRARWVAFVRSALFVRII